MILNSSPLLSVYDLVNSVYIIIHALCIVLLHHRSSSLVALSYTLDTRGRVSIFWNAHQYAVRQLCIFIHCSKTRIDLYSYFCFIYSVSFSACPHHIFYILGDWDDSVSTSLLRFSIKHPNNSLCSLRSRKQFLEGFRIVFGFFFGSGFGLFLGVLSWYHLPCICNSLELESVILHGICYIWAWLLCILHGICYI